MGKGKGFSFNQGIVLGMILLLAVGVGMYFKQPASIGPTGAVVEPTAVDGACEAVQCFQNPAYTYSVADKFDASAITGTTKIKVNDKAPVASLAAPQKCTKLQYWLLSTTDFVTPITEDEVKCGANQIQATGIANGSVTLSAYDQFTVLTNGGGANNITLGANGIKNVDYTWEGEAEKAAMPFGGCMCVEYPSSLSYAKPSGAGLSDASCEYKKTYTTSSTDNTYQCYNVPEGFDAAGTGEKLSMSIQYKAGSTDPAGTAVMTFFPANYYVTDDGNFALGVEKDLNDDTTATFTSANSFTIGIN